MRSLIRHITRKSRGGFSVREEIAEEDVLVIGRGADCAIYLPDPRILLRHAELQMRAGELYVTALSNADVRINGNLVNVGKLTTADVLHAGPFEIKREDVPEAMSGDGQPDVSPPDLILTVEMVQPLEDDLLQLVERSRTDVTRIGLPLRTWSWVLALAVLLLTFAVPLVLNFFHKTPDAQTLTRLHAQPAAAPTRWWTSGSISSSHKFFGTSCGTCHEIPFISVRDKACLHCHDTIQQHAMEARYPLASFRSFGCADCHKEHRGEVPSRSTSSHSACRVTGIWFIRPMIRMFAMPRTSAPTTHNSVPPSWWTWPRVRRIAAARSAIRLRRRKTMASYFLMPAICGRAVCAIHGAGRSTCLAKIVTLHCRRPFHEDAHVRGQLSWLP